MKKVLLFFIVFVLTVSVGIFQFLYYPNIVLKASVYSVPDSECRIEYILPDISQQEILGKQQNQYKFHNCNINGGLENLVSVLETEALDIYNISIAKELRNTYKNVKVFYFNDITLGNTDNHVKNYLFPMEASELDQVYITSFDLPLEQISDKVNKAKFEEYNAISYPEVLMIVRSFTEGDNHEVSIFYNNNPEDSSYSIKDSNLANILKNSKHQKIN